jgi:hypothetical protein
MSLKLPKPYSEIIHKEYGKTYEIMEAYVDEREEQLINGVSGIRALLSIGDDETICDLFCKIKINGNKIIYLIMEGKESKHDGNQFKAKSQLESSNKLIRNKLRINVNYAVLCGISLEQPFKAKKQFDMPFKAVHYNWNGRSGQVNLEGSEIPLLCA